jgi:polar amino acid transport system substrate-binding protein
VHFFVEWPEALIMSNPPGSQVRFAYLIEPPFCFLTSDGLVTGCDVELVRCLLQNIGAGSPAVIETEFDQLIAGVRDGRWDLTTGLFVTEARQLCVDFTRPIWLLHDGLLIRSGDRGMIAGYHSLAQAPDRRIGVVRDQVQHTTALNLGVRADQVRQFATYVDAARAVIDGTIDACASVAMAHRRYLEQYRDAGLCLIEVPQFEKPAARGAFAVSKTKPELLAALNVELSRFVGTAEHRALMYTFGFSAADVDLIAVDHA